ncbi:MAG TPA: hypothetical protein PKE57_01330 [Cellvibrionaceae bacterium]|nr:hypothetical protein [Cellvibrionaceae bacterium]HMW49312.1 hypothetical protein [Cellvibrionaceae bacterium]
MKNILFLALTILAFPTKSLATDAYLNNVKIESVAVIARAGPHKPGNLEVKILNGFTLPTGLNCDTNYLATKDTTPGFPYMAAMMMLAYDKQKLTTLIVSDDPADSGFPGRCSIVATVLK